jgi:uncharacterized alkaline shock family protein YloU
MTAIEESKRLTIAPGVVESIISLAVLEVEGVASVATPTTDVFMRILGRRRIYPGILVLEEDGQIIVDVHVHAVYGYRLPDVAEAIREAVADALFSQVGTVVSVVNVTIEGIQFPGN